MHETTPKAADRRMPESYMENITYAGTSVDGIRFSS